MYFYRCYGLTIASECALPFLQADPAQPIDLFIAFGAIHTALEVMTPIGLGLHCSPDKIILSVHGIARYEILRANQIIIEADPTVDQTSMLNFLIAAAIPYFIVLQNQCLVLRGCAFSIDGESAHIIVGNSGAGKSSVLAALCKSDVPVLSDQWCVVSFDKENLPRVEFGFPQIKLWKKTLTLLSMEATSLARPTVRRYLWTVPENFFISRALPIATIFTLTEQNLKCDVLCTIMRGAKKLNKINQFQLCPRFIDILQAEKINAYQKNNMKKIIQVLNAVTLYHLIRIGGLTSLSETKSLILKTLSARTVSVE